MAHGSAARSFRSAVEARILPVAADAVTLVRAYLPQGGRRLLLTHLDPRALPAHYCKTITPAAEMPLVHFQPDRTPGAHTGFLPGRFKKLVTVAIDETFGALRERFDERMYATAAVYDLAGTAMAAVMDPETSSRVIAAGHYHALLGGAEPGLRTGLGFYNREDRSVYVPEGLTPLSAVPITEFDPREVGCPEEPTCNWF